MTEIDRDDLFLRFRAAKCLTSQTRGIGGQRGWDQRAGEVFAFLCIMEPQMPLQERLKLADAVARNKAWPTPTA